MPPLIAAEAVEVAFGAKRALAGVDFAVPAGAPTITAIVGESGSGKTTLTRLLLGLLAPSAGRVRYEGADLAAMAGPARRVFRREVQAIFQDPFGVYNPFYRVDRALRLPLRRFSLAASRDEEQGLMRAALEKVGLRPAETLGRFPHQLSGGQRQRVMIARALLLKPKLLVADEPVSMVDASLRATILESLERLRSQAGISIVYVTHDLTTAYQIADRIVVLYQGAIVEEGDPEAVIHRPSHPYTRALIAAIPQPDPSIPWGLEEAGAQG